MTSATVPAQPEPANGFTRGRRAFRDWRRTRPFWAGLLILCAAGPILYFPYASLNVSGVHIQLATTAGAGSLVIGLLLASLGISVWFQQQIRYFAGVAAIVLSLVSFVISNFGGFLVGMLLGLVGGMLALAWAPLKPAKAAAEELVEDDEPIEESTPLAAMMTAEEPPTVTLPEQKAETQTVEAQTAADEEAPRGE